MVSNLDELDASLSSVSDRAYSIRAGMKTAEERMKKLQKLIEYGKNYTEYKPIHDELKKLQNGWTNKRDKYEEAHRAELTLWNAASRYLHANLQKGTKTLPIAEWEQEYADLKTQRDSDYTKLKDTRTNVSELQKIRKCVDIALRADQAEQTQSRTKRHDIDRCKELNFYVLHPRTDRPRQPSRPCFFPAITGRAAYPRRTGIPLEAARQPDRPGKQMVQAQPE